MYNFGKSYTAHFIRQLGLKFPIRVTSLLLANHHRRDQPTGKGSPERILVNHFPGSHIPFPSGEGGGQYGTISYGMVHIGHHGLGSSKG